jgi:7-cyano-7-deazaguanine synthase
MSTPNLLPTLKPAEHSDAALVLFSGGQDSTTCLYWALHHFKKVEAIGFHYGQKHAVELEQARKIAERAAVPFTVLDLRGLLRGSALTEHEQDVSAAHPLAPHLPATFVPGRNALFLTLAASYGFTRGIHDLVGGMCQTDYSGYPDCRREFIDAMERALSLALDTTIRIHTPLMHLTKAETWRLARELGILDVIVELTHTDYNGDRSERHAWGYGRLDNPASILRARGYEEAKARGWLD